jgi:hypothetical protein
MTRTKTPDEEVEALNRRLNTPEDAKQKRRNGAFRAATWPASGADMHAARAGAELAGEDAESETEEALQRATERPER